MDFLNQFIKYRKEYINLTFQNLNQEQRKAVFKVEGPLLILAGAGSGKTTVIVNRIYNLIRFGNAFHSDKVYGEVTADEVNILKRALELENNDVSEIEHLLSVSRVNPYNILAITFTNKSAKELKERIDLKIGIQSKSTVHSFTFHSLCMRILRSYADVLGYTSSFTIYDSDDQKRVLRGIYKELDVDEKIFPYKYIINKISYFKNNMMNVVKVGEQSDSYKDKIIFDIYSMYQDYLKNSNAMDFDDLITNTINLFESNSDILEKYQNLYKYVMVDEYQDTNFVQYKLVKMISQKHQNICAVGDDDQSIYKFRGATIDNILKFEEHFKNTEVIKLEENYRSTKNILNSANDVIKNNSLRKSKSLWTSKDNGDKVAIYKCHNENEEAEYICEVIENEIKSGFKLSDFAILYRVNAQSNLLEQFFSKRGIPYKLFGGISFFDRKEIKDVLSYLSVINNSSDNLRLKRIINEPKRGIGEKTLLKAENIANGLGVSLFDVLKNYKVYPDLKKCSKNIEIFVELIEKYISKVDNLSLYDLTLGILEDSGYMDYLKSLGFEGETRLENISELLSNISSFERNNTESGINEFLEDMALITSLDSFNQGDDYVSMMTLHSAKGLEFKNVFIIALEDGLLPSKQSEIEGSLEEERRLFYVGITRAKQNLYLTHAQTRMIFGKTTRNISSRFLDEISPDYVEYTDITCFKNTYLNLNTTPKKSINMSGGLTVGNSHKKVNVKICDNETYNAGDNIVHKIFGKGIVVSVTPISNDFLLLIEFENGIQKKVMANFANLKKV